MIVDAEVHGRLGRTVRVEHGVIAAIDDGAHGRSDAGPRAGDDILDAGGGALVPGLHDHHVHLLSLAARDRSVPCGPPAVVDRGALVAALARAAGRASAGPPGSPLPWIRGFGYDEAVAGPLDADRLDALLGSHRHRSVRIQHRSGHRWVVNRAGLAALGLGVGAGAPAGATLAADGTPTGVLDGLDGWLGDRLDDRAGEDAPPLGAVSARLSGYGVTGVTDATVTNGERELSLFEAATGSGELLQSVHLLGTGLPPGQWGRVSTGATKVVLRERQLPSLDWLVATIRAADRQGVAIHAVTREALVLAATALSVAGGGPHRIEHASVAPPDIVDLLAPLDVTVVTQPGFVAEHGDRYRRDVEPDDQAWLYRLAGWDRASVPLAGSTDAPFGSPDPWAAMAAAVERRSTSGVPIGPDERVTPERALTLFLGRPSDPGGPSREVSVGAPADLCLLAVPWREARLELSSALVRCTVHAGRPVPAREPPLR